MLSLLGKAKQLKTTTSRMYLGDTFDSMGYGFLVVENLTKNDGGDKRELLTEINFGQLRLSGY